MLLIMLNLVEGIDDSEYDTDLYEELLLNWRIFNE